MYRQNYHNFQSKNAATPNGNPQNVPSTSVYNFISPYPHNTSSFQQVQQPPRLYELPMEARMPHSNSYYFNNQQQSLNIPRNSFTHQTSNVQNSHYNQPLYVQANSALENNSFVVPNNVHRFEASDSKPQTIPPMQYNTMSAALAPNINRNVHTMTLTPNSSKNVNAWIEPNPTIKSYENPSQESARAITKQNENEKIRIFTGTAEKILKWHKIYKNYFCYYEIVASIVSIQEGAVPLQKIMLLRDKKGPIIQIIHYVWDHINIENFFVGQMLRCIGRMVGPSIMHGLSIREATPEEVATIQRMSYISEHAISRALVKV